MRLFAEFCAFSYFPSLRAKKEQLKAAIQTFREELVATDTFLTRHGTDEGPFLFGNTFSLAESNAAPFLQRACIVLPGLTGQEMEVSVNPMDICDELGLIRLKQWIKAVLMRPSVVATGVPKVELVKRTKSMLERFAQMKENSQ
jgi:glutathione S-transferase